jgi:DegV family protein with EDD domain
MTTHTVALVTDSTADLPAEWLSRWDIGVVPAYINIGPESYPDDGIAITRERFYARQKEGKPFPTTSAPPLGVAVQGIKAALAKADHVLVYTVAAAFSSIYNTLRLAAEECDPKRVTVVDSGSLSLGIGWQVVAAAEALAAGGDVQAAMAAAQATREKIEVWAVADTLEHLRRGGRVNPVLAGIGSLLQIKPVFSMKESKVEVVERIRTMKKAVASVAEMTRKAAPLSRLAVLHSLYPEGAALLKESLADVVPSQVITVDVTPVIGVHFGAGSLGVALVKA